MWNYEPGVLFNNEILSIVIKLKSSEMFWSLIITEVLNEEVGKDECRCCNKRQCIVLYNS